MAGLREGCGLCQEEGSGLRGGGMWGLLCPGSCDSPQLSMLPMPLGSSHLLVPHGALLNLRDVKAGMASPSPALLCEFAHKHLAFIGLCIVCAHAWGQTYELSKS